MFIYGMVLRCAGAVKLGLSLDQLQQIRQPSSYIHTSKLVINDVKPDHSITPKRRDIIRPSLLMTYTV